jgi:hypothetical protein
MFNALIAACSSSFAIVPVTTFYGGLKQVREGSRREGPEEGCFFYLNSESKEDYGAADEHVGEAPEVGEHPVSAEGMGLLVLPLDLKINFPESKSDEEATEDREEGRVGRNLRNFPRG